MAFPAPFPETVRETPRVNEERHARSSYEPLGGDPAGRITEVSGVPVRLTSHGPTAQDKQVHGDREI